ncbi:MAG: type II toxin-antitoxin system VapC family toxin [Gemmatimonadales bacterium]
MFLDTSAWLPVVVRREQGHTRLRATYQQLLEGGGRLVTSNLVVAELHALVVRRRGAEAGVALIESVHADPAHDVMVVDRALEARAVDRWLRPFHDKRFSLCDAVSFEIMRQERIRTAFALDTHFTVAGFEMVR